MARSIKQDTMSSSRPNIGTARPRASIPTGFSRSTGQARSRRRIYRDSIHGVTKGSVRRMARRGGVKRISASIYDEVRQALKDRLALLLKDIQAIVGHCDRKTVTVYDVVFVLRRHGTPIYGF